MKTNHDYIKHLPKALLFFGAAITFSLLSTLGVLSIFDIDPEYLYYMPFIFICLFGLACFYKVYEVVEELNSNILECSSSNESEKLKQELIVYKCLAEEIYQYAGSYPVWKAQQEFRQLLSDNNIPLTDKYTKEPFPHPSKAEYIDIYFSKVIDSFAKAIRKGELDFVRDAHFWSEKELPEARANELVNYI